MHDRHVFGGSSWLSLPLKENHQSLSYFFCLMCFAQVFHFTYKSPTKKQTKMGTVSLQMFERKKRHESVNDYKPPPLLVHPLQISVPHESCCSDFWYDAPVDQPKPSWMERMTDMIDDPTESWEVWMTWKSIVPTSGLSNGINNWGSENLYTWTNLLFAFKVCFKIRGFKKTMASQRKCLAVYHFKTNHPTLSLLFIKKFYPEDQNIPSTVLQLRLTIIHVDLAGIPLSFESWGMFCSHAHVDEQNVDGFSRVSYFFGWQTT